MKSDRAWSGKDEMEIAMYCREGGLTGGSDPTLRTVLNRLIYIRDHPNLTLCIDDLDIYLDYQLSDEHQGAQEHGPELQHLLHTMLVATFDG